MTTQLESKLARVRQWKHAEHALGLLVSFFFGGIVWASPAGLVLWPLFALCVLCYVVSCVRALSAERALEDYQERLRWQQQRAALDSLPRFTETQ